MPSDNVIRLISVLKCSLNVKTLFSC